MGSNTLTFTQSANTRVTKTKTQSVASNPRNEQLLGTQLCFVKERQIKNFVKIKEAFVLVCMNSILTQGSIFSTIIFLLSKPSRVWSCCSDRYDEFPWSLRRKLLPFLNRQRLKNTFLLPFHYFLFDERWRNRLTSFSIYLIHSKQASANSKGSHNQGSSVCTRGTCIISCDEIILAK